MCSSDLDPAKLDLEKLKEAIATQKLNVGKIEKQGLSRLKLTQPDNTFWNHIPGFGVYSGVQANEDIDNVIKTFKDEITEPEKKALQSNVLKLKKGLISKKE